MKTVCDVVGVARSAVAAKQARSADWQDGRRAREYDDMALVTEIYDGVRLTSPLTLPRRRRAHRMTSRSSPAPRSPRETVLPHLLAAPVHRTSRAHTRGAIWPVGCGSGHSRVPREPGTLGRPIEPAQPRACTRR